MRHIEVIGTGGTIVSRESGGASGVVAVDSVESLIRPLNGIQVTVSDLFQTGSYRLKFSELRLISESIAAAVARPEIDGVVVSHGTDTMEETAFLADLVHASHKPVVFTGAQRNADLPDTDGPRNLREAIEAAAEPTLAGIGAAISFAGELLSARGTRKSDTLAPMPFGDGVRIAVHGMERWIKFAHPERAASLPLPSDAFDHLRIEPFAVAPGTDPDMIRRECRHGLDGIVLIGTGAGNAGDGYADVVKECVGEGIPVVLATRVSRGPVAGIYGNGGGADLLAAGALSAGRLNPYQARILLALLLDQSRQIETLALQLAQHNY